MIFFLHIRYDELQCVNGNAKICLNTGNMYFMGQDYKKATELYEKACQMGKGIGCNNLGVLYEKGLGVLQDYRKASELYKKARELGAE